MLNKIISSPKRLFLIDSIGALLTAFLLGTVLTRFEVVFGMPKTILYYLSLIALLISIYSICCHFLLNGNWKPYLKGIIIANLTYCLMSIGLIVCFYQKLTFIGLFYFISEILIIIILVAVELKTLSKLLVQFENR